MSVILTLFLALSVDVAATTPINITGSIRSSKQRMNKRPGSLNHTVIAESTSYFFNIDPIEKPITSDMNMLNNNKLFRIFSINNLQFGLIFF